MNPSSADWTPSQEQSIQQPNRRNRFGDRPKCSLVHIAIGEKVFSHNCSMQFQTGTKRPFILLSFSEPAADSLATKDIEIPFNLRFHSRNGCSQDGRAVLPPGAQSFQSRAKAEVITCYSIIWWDNWAGISNWERSLSLYYKEIPARIPLSKSPWILRIMRPMARAWQMLETNRVWMSLELSL